MTQRMTAAPPQAATLAAIAPIVAAPFTQAALDAAVPKPPPVVETPEEQAALAAEPPPVAAPPAPPSGRTKLQEAQEAAAALVAKRAAARKSTSATQTETHRLAAENARLQAERDAANARAAALDADPLAELRKRGIPEKAIQQAAIDDASPEGRIARLERELQARDARDAERQRQEQIARESANLTQREEQFARGAIAATVKSEDGTDEAAYPLLAARAKVAGGIVVAEAHAIIKRDIDRQIAEGTPRNRLKIPTNEDVYEYQEWLLQQSLQATLGASAQADTGAPPAADTQAPAAPKPPKPNGTRTLSAKRVPPAAAPKPYGQMTEAERLAHDAAALRALHTK